MITFDDTYAKAFLSQQTITKYKESVKEAYQKIFEKSGAGNDFLGWTTLPSEMAASGLLKDIKTTASQLAAEIDVFVVIGIGGSYLGARAVIEALRNGFGTDGPEVVYAGHQMSEDYMAELLTYLDNKEYALTVISKSGTTTEPAIAFRILKNHLEKKYSKEIARKKIVAITDKAKGALKKLADNEGYKTYVVPDDVGGRYSVLTPVGLLPIAVAGIDIEALIQGALDMELKVKSRPAFEEDVVARYAVARNALHATGRTTEIMVNYQPKLFYFTEWWKQLFGESEGKDGKGTFPAGVGFTTDLHSMGQYIQEGMRIMMETVLAIEQPDRHVVIPEDENNLDALNYIAGKRIEEVNKMAELGTLLAHVDGGVPNMRIAVPRLDTFNLGSLIYFFEMACAVSGYLLGVNPFNQPGVEAYKKNMFALLGKPGFEDETAKIQSRIQK
jgi:glucose-6-phosphate isomerase